MKKWRALEENKVLQGRKGENSDMSNMFMIGHHTHTHTHTHTQESHKTKERERKWDELKTAKRKSEREEGPRRGRDKGVLVVISFQI